jgi:STE24 endopeptidase
MTRNLTLGALALTLGIWILAAPPARGQGAPATPAATAQPAADADAPVPVPEPSARAWSYYRSGNVLWGINTLWGFLVPALLLFTGASARMRTAAARLGRSRFLTIALYFVLFSAVTFLLDLPLSYYAGYVREHAYGLSNQSLGKWLGNSLKQLAVGTVVGAALLWIPYLLLAKSPKRWWIYLGALTAPLLTLTLLLVPVWFDPLFNKFGPMHDKGLEAQILHLADRAGIEGSRVFEVDKSADTERVNAYVTGLGNTKRIVLWDTLLKKFSEREILFVVGHEMGHYVLGHVARLILLGTAMAFLCLFILHRSARGLLARYSGRFGFTELADVASLPLILLVAELVAFVATPGLLAFGRHTEHEADRFGLEITRDNQAAARAFVKLGSENLGIPRPGPLYKLWRSDHPPLGERIDFCNTYRPWEKGEPLEYGDRIDRKR